MRAQQPDSQAENPQRKHDRHAQSKLCQDDLGPEKIQIDSSEFADVDHRAQVYTFSGRACGPQSRAWQLLRYWSPTFVTSPLSKSQVVLSPLPILKTGERCSDGCQIAFCSSGNSHLITEQLHAKESKSSA